MTETVEKQTPENENERLQRLVADLVEKNQALRFKVQALERRARQTQAALEEASTVYRFLVP